MSYHNEALGTKLVTTHKRHKMLRDALLTRRTPPLRYRS
jgi:hypothetical protein